MARYLRGAQGLAAEAGVPEQETFAFTSELNSARREPCETGAADLNGCASAASPPFEALKEQKEGYKYIYIYIYNNNEQDNDTINIFIIILIVLRMEHTKFVVLKTQESREFRTTSQKPFFFDAQTAILKDLRAMEGATS